MNRVALDDRLPWNCREIVLPRIGGEFPQVWQRDGPGSNGGSDAQDVGPIALGP